MEIQKYLIVNYDNVKYLCRLTTIANINDIVFHYRPYMTSEKGTFTVAKEATTYEDKEHYVVIASNAETTNLASLPLSVDEYYTNNWYKVTNAVVRERKNTDVGLYYSETSKMVCDVDVVEDKPLIVRKRTCF